MAAKNKVSSQTALEVARDLIAALEEAQPGDNISLIVDKTHPDLYTVEIISSAKTRPHLGEGRSWHLEKVKSAT